MFFKPDAFGWRRSADLNLHAYVGADPVNFTDPDGLNRKKPDIPPKQDGGGSGTTITVTASAADQALRDTLIMLNRIETHEFLHARMGSNGETSSDDIVVTAIKPDVPDSPPPPPPLPTAPLPDVEIAMNDTISPLRDLGRRIQQEWNEKIYNSELSRCVRAHGFDLTQGTARGIGGGLVRRGPWGTVTGGLQGFVFSLDRACGPAG
jgi:hypothetical protein